MRDNTESPRPQPETGTISLKMFVRAQHPVDVERAVFEFAVNAELADVLPTHIDEQAQEVSIDVSSLTDEQRAQLSAVLTKLAV